MNKNIDSKLEEALKGFWDALTEEQKEKVKACKTMDELVKLVGKEGIELPDEALEGVSGGATYHYNQRKRTHEVTSDDGKQVYESFNDEQSARVNVDFYTFLESVGYFD